MTKWFRRKNSNLVDLFIQEFPKEYEWAQTTRQNVTEKYVQRFLQSQKLYQE